MQSGISSNSGSQPHQATVTVSFLAFNGPEERNSRGQNTLGTGNGPASYTIHRNELVVMDRRYHAPGHTPAVFSSLTGLEYDKRAGDAGLNRRLAAVGVAINHIHFNAASGLANQRVTVVTNGLVPISWTSEHIEPPSPGDLVVAYPPSTVPAIRENQLRKVNDNAAGQRYQGDIVGDNRTPMLMKKFTGTEMDDLPIEGLEWLVENFDSIWSDIDNYKKRTNLPPAQMFAIHVMLAPLAAFLNLSGAAELRDLGKAREALFTVLAVHYRSYATTEKTARWLAELSRDDEKLAGASELSAVTRNSLITYRNLLLGCMTSVIGRIVGTRIDGMVPIFLG